jgi:transposase
LRVAQFRYPLHRYTAAFRRNEPLRRPRASATMLAIYRNAFQLHHLEILPSEASLFHRLREGATVEDAIASAGRIRTATIQRAFQNWFAAGIFQPLD